LLPLAVEPFVTSRHLAPPYIVSVVPVQVHSCAVEPTQSETVTRAPLVLDAAVKHLLALAPGLTTDPVPAGAELEVVLEVVVLVVMRDEVVVVVVVECELVVEVVECELVVEVVDEVDEVDEGPTLPPVIVAYWTQSEEGAAG